MVEDELKKLPLARLPDDFSGRVVAYIRRQERRRKRLIWGLSLLVFMLSLALLGAFPATLNDLFGWLADPTANLLPGLSDMIDGSPDALLILLILGLALAGISVLLMVEWMTPGETS
jgi:hypothetical protein